MSLKFMIKNRVEQARKEGDHFVRYSGTGEPFNRTSERAARATATDPQGSPVKWLFSTGLDEDEVQFYKWFTDDEKKVVQDTIKNLKDTVQKYFGGPEVIAADNYSFWKRRKDINELKVTHESVDIFYDTNRPEHALLYLSIIGGAFSDLVAPNKDWADRFQLPHYLALETEVEIYSDDNEISRSEAHGELTALRKEFGREALYILAWCMHYDTSAFGAYSGSASERDLITYHIKFIDGKLQMKKKKNCPRVFLEYAGKWRGAQTRKQLFTEAYVKAGEYFNFINQREKKYTTADGTILGNTIADAVTNLEKPKFQVDLVKLRESVESKWKE